jgi:acetoin utilization deacetylase AcuC-like enzyme
MSVALVTHRDYLKHITGPGHPERPQRLQAILSGIESSGLSGALTWLTPEPMAREQLATVHTHAHLDRIEALARAGGGYLDPDTIVSPDSYDVARLAAGGAALALSTVLEGSAQYAFALVRPPGHHASANEGMGFCLLNNAAAATSVARAQYGLERIFLIDWDVHHGNGTQAIF